MNSARRRIVMTAAWAALACALAPAPGCAPRTTQKAEEPMELTHEQTLDWIRQNQAWRRARKTKPLWARPVEPDELGKEFQTADRAVERAREGYWLCAGVVGEPWFQKQERIDSRYERSREEVKQFAFDSRPRTYQVYKPKEITSMWVAQVKGAGVKGLTIRPNYDLEHPLYSPAGGYVVKDNVPDPYQDHPEDVWLVQEKIFDSTYEFMP